jgi:ATP-dependent helicase/nuclease subunit B
MSVQFILGRSGTGKTGYCIRAIVEVLLEPSDRPLLFLVPEQATYQAERAILSDKRLAGYHRLHILSFDRLQFMLLGKNTARPLVSRLGRQMIVHKILRDIREELTVFRSSALLPGFAREIAETIAEMYRYAKTADEVTALPGKLSSEGAGHPSASSGQALAAMKFADIARIFQAYMQYLSGRFVDPDAQIVDASRKVQEAELLKGAHLWVDGFSGFTEGEMAVLVELLKRVDRAHIALSMDPAHVAQPPSAGGTHPETDVFEPTERTHAALLDAIGRAKIELRPPVYLQHVSRFSKAPALGHIERYLFIAGAHRMHAGDSIRLIAAPSPRMEVQTIARQIVSLVRDKGYRYRDIAVVASDLDRYEHYVRGYFGDYEIPFFIDKRKPLTRHPVIELLGTALAAVTEGFSRGDVFAYLKTDLASLDRADVDLLENYCLAFGVEGRDWTDPEPWQFQGGVGFFDERRINEIRHQAAKPLLDLREVLCPGGDTNKTLTAVEFTRTVFAFLDGLQVRRKVAQWVDAAKQTHDLAAADEHQQFFDRFVDVFDELAEVFRDDHLNASEYAALLNLAFSQMTLAFIPPSLDQVLVGSIERSRHPNLKAVFLMGATQKQFPVPLSAGGVLSDEDRQAAEAAGFHVAPTSTQSLVEREYLAYIAYTRPSEFLCISYPAVDEKGAAVVRSHFVDEVTALFDDLREQSVEDIQPQIEDLYETSEMAEWLCARLGRDVFAPVADEASLKGVLRAMRADQDYRPAAGAITSALEYHNHAVLGSAVVERFLAGRTKGSVTELETFAACPFKHFAQFTLKLKPRREFRLEPLDLGRFYHDVLDALHKSLAVKGSNFADADEQDLLRSLREQVEIVTAKIPFIAQFKTHSIHNDFILRNAGGVLEECVLEIARTLRAGAFRPFISEVAFGQTRDTQQSLGPFEISLSQGRVLVMSGRIDRIDLAHVDGTRVALIIDYKTSTFGALLQWWKVYHGLGLQLPVYMLAVLDTKNRLADDVAGAVCVPIEVALKAGDLTDGREEAPAFRRKARGPLNGMFHNALDATASGTSQFYSFYVTKDGDPYGNYQRQDILRPEHFRALLTWVRRKVVDLAEDRMSGRIEVKPYRYHDERPCTFCDYLPVCRFDWQINDYNFLDPKGKLDIVGEAAKP